MEFEKRKSLLKQRIEKHQLKIKNILAEFKKIDIDNIETAEELKAVEMELNKLYSKYDEVKAEKNEIELEFNELKELKSNSLLAVHEVES